MAVPSTTAPVVQATPTPTTPQAHPRTPERLRLWKFDAPVVSISLDGGALTPPSDPQVLGWWGKPAGAAHGTTLLTGHTVHDGGGEFDDLEKVKVGQVANLSGAKYEVSRVEVMSKTAMANRAPKLFRQGGKPRLVLVTCEGYNPATGNYSDNVVVTLQLQRK